MHVTTMSPETLKVRLAETLVAHLEHELARSLASQKVTQEGATHPEAKPENDKDTRAIEASYLARGLAARVNGLRDDIIAVRRMEPVAFDDGTPIGLSAVVDVEPESDEAETTVYFIAPAGGGLRLHLDGGEYVVVTPHSPLGKALIGKSVDDEVRVETPRGTRLATVTRVV